VFLSGIGAGDSRGSGGFFFENIAYPFVLARNFEDKNRAEALIMKSHKDWTILRPGKLTNRKRKGQVLALTKSSDYRNGSISRADVGQYICECVKNGLNIHETPVLIS
jgi:hypothetical protein